MSICIDSVSQLTRNNRLQLNALKTENIWCAPARRRYHIPSGDVKVRPDSVRPVQSARDLGVNVDSDMSMTTHVNHVLLSFLSCIECTIYRLLLPMFAVSVCLSRGLSWRRVQCVQGHSVQPLPNYFGLLFSALRQIRTIKRSLPSHALDTLVTSLVHSRLDYCNVVFAGLPARDHQRLQSVLNDAAQLVSNSLRDRHWQPITQRVQFKFCMMVYRCLYGKAPSCLAKVIIPTAIASIRTDQGRIQEFWKGGPVKGRSPEQNAEGASAGGGSGGTPHKILKN